MTSHMKGQHSYGNGLINQAGRRRQTSTGLPPFLDDYVPVLPKGSGHSSTPSQRRTQLSGWRNRSMPLGRLLLQSSTRLLQRLGSWKCRDILGIHFILIIAWGIVLWWGEEVVFRRKVNSCTWDRWENWPPTATPHHVVLIADPQLVDPHTYPGRPWPLSTLTVRYTDLYIRKSFQQILKTLSPQSVFFLGDLFDGGREWSTSSGSSEERESPDKRWTRYDTSFWLKEYGRFSRIFFDPWLRANEQDRQAQLDRKLIAGLPGNHDLGLGNGIRVSVRQRFQAYFGDGNRIDIVGNHSFVSLDTVSLSAKGQPEASGGQRANEGSHDQQIWGPVTHFLHAAKTEKVRAVERELRIRSGKSENELLEHISLELDDSRVYTASFQDQKSTDMPSVVLTHVPFYRAEGTPCGPLRERYPQSKAPNGEFLEKDDRNSIHVQAGLQYQNVLTPEVSNEIVDLLGDVTNIFSGDDHDYCDVIHHGYTSRNGGIREVTVKSISWAMGVRHPGFLLLSLWNPMDTATHHASTKDSTIQTHLCLLPDQLSIFIRYLWLLLFTLFMLLGRAIKKVQGPFSSAKQSDGHFLPLARLEPRQSTFEETTSSSARLPSSQNQLAVRSSAGRPRSTSPSNGYGYVPQGEEPFLGPINGKADKSEYDTDRDKRWKEITFNEVSHRKRFTGLLEVLDEFRASVMLVASVVLPWYIWLLLNS